MKRTMTSDPLAVRILSVCRKRRRAVTRTAAIAALACFGITGIWSCTKEPPANDQRGKEPPAAGTPPSNATNGGSQEPPEIPVDVMPKVIKALVDYPEEARDRGEQGIVRVKALVGKDGRVTEASVDTAQPVSDVLAKAAVAAVKQWTFEPGKQKGEPVAVWIVVPVNFKLH